MGVWVCASVGVGGVGLSVLCNVCLLVFWCTFSCRVKRDVPGNIVAAATERLIGGVMSLNEMPFEEKRSFLSRFSGEAVNVLTADEQLALLLREATLSDEENMELLSLIEEHVRRIVSGVVDDMRKRLARYESLKTFSSEANLLRVQSTFRVQLAKKVDVESIGKVMRTMVSLIKKRRSHSLTEKDRHAVQTLLRKAAEAGGRRDGAPVLQSKDRGQERMAKKLSEKNVPDPCGHMKLPELKTSGPVKKGMKDANSSASATLGGPTAGSLLERGELPSILSSTGPYGQAAGQQPRNDTLLMSRVKDWVGESPSSSVGVLLQNVRISSLAGGHVLPGIVADEATGGDETRTGSALSPVDDATDSDRPSEPAMSKYLETGLSNLADLFKGKTVPKWGLDTMRGRAESNLGLGSSMSLSSSATMRSGVASHAMATTGAVSYAAIVRGEVNMYQQQGKHIPMALQAFAAQPQHIQEQIMRLHQSSVRDVVAGIEQRFSEASAKERALGDSQKRKTAASKEAAAGDKDGMGDTDSEYGRLVVKNNHVYIEGGEDEEQIPDDESDEEQGKLTGMRDVAEEDDDSLDSEVEYNLEQMLLDTREGRALTESERDKCLKRLVELRRMGVPERKLRTWTYLDPSRSVEPLHKIIDNVDEALQVRRRHDELDRQHMARGLAGENIETAEEQDDPDYQSSERVTLGQRKHMERMYPEFMALNMANSARARADEQFRAGSLRPASKVVPIPMEAKIQVPESVSVVNPTLMRELDDDERLAQDVKELFDQLLMAVDRPHLQPVKTTEVGKWRGVLEAHSKGQGKEALKQAGYTADISSQSALHGQIGTNAKLDTAIPLAPGEPGFDPQLDEVVQKAIPPSRHVGVNDFKRFVLSRSTTYMRRTVGAPTKQWIKKRLAELGRLEAVALHEVGGDTKPQEDGDGTVWVTEEGQDEEASEREQVAQDDDPVTMAKNKRLAQRERRKKIRDERSVRRAKRRERRNRRTERYAEMRRIEDMQARRGELLAIAEAAARAGGLLTELQEQRLSERQEEAERRAQLARVATDAKVAGGQLSDLHAVSSHVDDGTVEDDRMEGAEQPHDGQGHDGFRVKTGEDDLPLVHDAAMQDTSNLALIADRLHDTGYYIDESKLNFTISSSDLLSESKDGSSSGGSAAASQEVIQQQPGRSDLRAGAVVVRDEGSEGGTPVDEGVVTGSSSGARSGTSVTVHRDGPGGEGRVPDARVPVRREEGGEDEVSAGRASQRDGHLVSVEDPSVKDGDVQVQDGVQGQAVAAVADEVAAEPVEEEAQEEKVGPTSKYTAQEKKDAMARAMAILRQESLAQLESGEVTISARAMKSFGVDVNGVMRRLEQERAAGATRHDDGEDEQAERTDEKGIKATSPRTRSKLAKTDQSASTTSFMGGSQTMSDIMADVNASIGSPGGVLARQRRFRHVRKSLMSSRDVRAVRRRGKSSKKTDGNETLGDTLGVDFLEGSGLMDMSMDFAKVEQREAEKQEWIKRRKQLGLRDDGDDHFDADADFDAFAGGSRVRDDERRRDGDDDQDEREDDSADGDGDDDASDDAQKEEDTIAEKSQQDLASLLIPRRRLKRKGNVGAFKSGDSRRPKSAGDELGTEAKGRGLRRKSQSPTSPDRASSRERRRSRGVTSRSPKRRTSMRKGKKGVRDAMGGSSAAVPEVPRTSLTGTRGEAKQAIIQRDQQRGRAKRVLFLDIQGNEADADGGAGATRESSAADAEFLKYGKSLVGQAVSATSSSSSLTQSYDVKPAAGRVNLGPVADALLMQDVDFLSEDSATSVSESDGERAINSEDEMDKALFYGARSNQHYGLLKVGEEVGAIDGTAMASAVQARVGDVNSSMIEVVDVKQGADSVLQQQGTRGSRDGAPISGVTGATLLERGVPDVPLPGNDAGGAREQKDRVRFHDSVQDVDDEVREYMAFGLDGDSAVLRRGSEIPRALHDVGRPGTDAEAIVGRSRSRSRDQSAHTHGSSRASGRDSGRLSPRPPTSQRDKVTGERHVTRASRQMVGIKRRGTWTPMVVLNPMVSGRPDVQSTAMQERLETLWSECHMPVTDRLEFIVRHSMADSGTPRTSRLAHQWADERRDSLDSSLVPHPPSSAPADGHDVDGYMSRSVSAAAAQDESALPGVLSATPLAKSGSRVSDHSPRAKSAMFMRRGSALALSSSKNVSFERVVVLWENCLAVVGLRERVLDGLRLFELDASDPARFFESNTAEHLILQEKQRKEFVERFNEVSAAVLKRLRRLWHETGDIFTWYGVPYVLKMQTDVVRMLHELDVDRLAAFYETFLHNENVDQLAMRMHLRSAGKDPNTPSERYTPGLSLSGRDTGTMIGTLSPIDPSAQQLAPERIGSAPLEPRHLLSSGAESTHSDKKSLIIRGRSAQGTTRRDSTLGVSNTGGMGSFRRSSLSRDGAGMANVQGEERSHTNSRPPRATSSSALKAVTFGSGGKNQ